MRKSILVIATAMLLVLAAVFTLGCNNTTSPDGDGPTPTRPRTESIPTKRIQIRCAFTSRTARSIR